MLKDWKDMTDSERESAYKALTRVFEDLDSPSGNPKCPNCNQPIDWVTFQGTCSLKAKVVNGKADWETTEVTDWDPASDVKDLNCYNCGEDIHTLIKEY